MGKPTRKTCLSASLDNALANAFLDSARRQRRSLSSVMAEALEAGAPLTNPPVIVPGQEKDNELQDAVT